jgi:hypothetical protein
MPEYLLGMSAKIYRGAVDAALGSLTEMSNVKDVTLNLSAAEADVTSRANSGWKAIAAALREASVDFGMVWKPADAGFAAIRDAYLAGTAIELAILDQDRAVSGAQGLKGNFTITAFNREEPLEQAIMVSVTAKLTKFNAWVVVA